MALGPPDDKFVEVNFSGSTWTDITDYVDWSVGLSTQFGRSSPNSQPQPATMTLTLFNDDGRFTPQRVLLADGVTAHPYWPNLLPRKGIRYGYVIGGTTYYRFTGEVNGWPPGQKNPNAARVTITATDVARRLSQVKLDKPLTDTYGDLSPSYYWPFTDGAGGGAAEVISGSSRFALKPQANFVTISDGGPALTFGADVGDGITGNGTCVQFAPDDVNDTGQTLVSGPLLTGTHVGTGSRLIWIRPDLGWDSSTTKMPFLFLQLSDNSRYYLGLNSSGQVIFVNFNTSTTLLTSSGTVIDGAWHMICLSWDGAAVTISIDSVDSGTTPFIPGGYISYVQVGGCGTDRFRGRVAHLALFGSVSGLSTAQQEAAYDAGVGYLSDTISDRVERYLDRAGLSPSEYDVDASTVMAGSYPQDGASVVQACQDMSVSEGGGSAFFADTDGTMRFTGRAALHLTPTLTLDAEGDIDGSSWAPAFDADNLANIISGTIANAGGTGATVTLRDSASQAAYGDTTDSFTSYAQSIDDVRDNVSDRLVRQANPAFRLGRVTVDLFTAETAGLYDAVGATTIGDRIRITNLTGKWAPTEQIDVTVQGWAETVSNAGYSVAFDTSPGDPFVPFVFDDDDYGRFADDGNTLNADITSTATTIVVATTSGNPTYTTASGDYPLNVIVDAEIITLTSAPGGASSPQTFTGVTRGANGTTALAHTAGADVAPYQQSAFTL